jgi:hypothetical protein
MITSCPSTARHVSGLAAGVLLAVAAAATPVAAKDGVASGIQGAWVEQSLKCDDIFTNAGGRPVFKKPVNLFAPALIITGTRLATPQASCRLKSATPEGDRTAVTLQCENTVSESDVKVYLAKMADGTLIRFYDAKDPSGSHYVACPMK